MDIVHILPVIVYSIKTSLVPQFALQYLHGQNVHEDLKNPSICQVETFVFIIRHKPE